MLRTRLSLLGMLVIIQFALGLAISSSLAQEWRVRVKPRGTLKVVDLWIPSVSVNYNYAESLVTLDRNNNYVPCLAEDWRWIDGQTIEFKLRRGVTFHNGEEFNAETLRVNWQEYLGMETPENVQYEIIPDETDFVIIDEHTVRFTFPAPAGLALVQFLDFQ